MEESLSSVRSVRFGVFEVDLRSGELRKKGAKIRLQGQPFLLLITLLKQQGEVVAREELRRTLWPTLNGTSSCRSSRSTGGFGRCGSRLVSAPSWIGSDWRLPRGKSVARGKERQKRAEELASARTGTAAQQGK